MAMGVDWRDCLEDVLLLIPGKENNREALRNFLLDKWAIVAQLGNQKNKSSFIGDLRKEKNVGLRL